MLEDTALVERARQGDIEAYSALVSRYQQIAARTAYLVSGGDAEAEDAVQDAVVKAYYALPRFHAGARFKPWLLHIVANEARNRRKATGRRNALALRTSAAIAPTDAAPSPESLALTHEQQSELLRLLNTLRDDDRLTIAARYFLDLTEAEMAEVLGCPRGTVKSRLSRALGRLRDALGQSDLGAWIVADRKDVRHG